MINLKEKLKRRELTIGTWLSFSYLPITEMMAKAMFEWLVIDIEHTSIDYKDVENMIRVIDSNNKFPIVRVGSNDGLIIKRVLDSGAKGIIVPMINSKKDAEKVVESVYYPPSGKRGVGLYRAQSYGQGFNEYKSAMQNESVVIAQIEHVKAVEKLSEILDVDGIDGIIVGPYDLSGSLGIPGDFNNKIFINTINEIKNITIEKRQSLGYHIVETDKKEITKKIKEGFNFIAYGDDMIIISNSIQSINRELIGV